MGWVLVVVAVSSFLLIRCGGWGNIPTPHILTEESLCQLQSTQSTPSLRQVHHQ